jgi:hypothetical protein
MDWNPNNLTPEERERIKGSGGFGFHCIIVERLIQESPVKTEPYTPPDEDIPASPYIPLALRMPPIPRAVYRQEFLDLLQRFEIATGPTGKDLPEK